MVAAAVAAVVAVLTVMAGAGGGAAIPAHAAAMVARSSAVPPPATDNPSWSGEVAWAASNGVAAFDHVTGAWVQPSIVASSSSQYADTWVGIDGYDGKLLQAGTTAWTNDGTVSYDAWFVAWTGTSSGMTVIDEPVAAGDRMRVAINRGAGGGWSAALEDATAGWSWSTTVTYAATGSTAEWIEEAPGTWSTPSHYQALADYGSATFTTMRANGVAPKTVTTLDIAANGVVLSSASTYVPSHGSFTVRYDLPARTGPPTGIAGAPGDAIYGQTADSTAAAELARVYPDADGSCPASHAAVVASTREYQDALASQFLAQELTSGTLLTPTASLSSVTAGALREEGIDSVYILGGPLAVTTAVANAIGDLTAYDCGGTQRAPTAGKIAVHRIDGATQYATAMKVAEYVGTVASLSFPGAYATVNATGGTGLYNDTGASGSGAPSAGPEPTAILASGQEFQDAQAASVLSYHTRLPMLLTSSTALSATAVAAIETLGVKQVILLGGPLAVSNTVEADLVAQTGVAVLRVAGKDYTDTARELARFEAAGAPDGLGWTTGRRLMVARGNGFTDGLSGAVLENAHNAATGDAGTAHPLLLTEGPAGVGAFLTAFLTTTGHTGVDQTTNKRFTTLTVLGGPLAVTSAEIDAMETDLRH